MWPGSMAQTTHRPLCTVHSSVPWMACAACSHPSHAAMQMQPLEIVAAMASQPSQSSLHFDRRATTTTLRFACSLLLALLALSDMRTLRLGSVRPPRILAGFCVGRRTLALVCDATDRNPLFPRSHPHPTERPRPNPRTGMAVSSTEVFQRAFVECCLGACM